MKLLKITRVCIIRKQLMLSLQNPGKSRFASLFKTQTLRRELASLFPRKRVGKFYEMFVDKRFQER